MPYVIPKLQPVRNISVDKYLKWLKLDHNPEAITVVQNLLSDIHPIMIVQDNSLSVKNVSRKIDRQIVNDIIRLSYSRYSNGMYPIDLCKEDSSSQLEHTYMVYNTYRFPMATIKSKLFVPNDHDYFINTLFTVQEPWYYKEKLLQEASRWAAHPVYDVYSLSALKTEVMRKAMTYVVSKYTDEKIRTVGIFSERVVQFIQNNDIAQIRRINVKKKTNAVRHMLEEQYGRYWQDGKPGVYELTTTV